MKVLYIFPHPDDESFGPATAMSKQIREGHEVYLLTLTKGGATKQRFKYNFSIDEMGEVRFKEMLNVKKVLNLTGMEILDLPDSGLKEMDPAEIEGVIEEHIIKVKPDVIVTYPVHGISGFHDHLVTHSAVKNVYCKLRDKEASPKRLAFYTVSKESADKQMHFKLSFSTDAEIDCIEHTNEEDLKNARAALDCYVTFKDTIDATGIKEQIPRDSAFEIFQKSYDPKLNSIFEKL
ncbi:MAG: Mycothiol S-conjugate amidase [Ignavibacteria bacterium]|nr:Mycothiol S-conjugate amidase [Ignavibacteria bacterium]